MPSVSVSVVALAVVALVAGRGLPATRGTCAAAPSAQAASSRSRSTREGTASIMVARRRAVTVKGEAG